MPLPHRLSPVALSEDQKAMLRLLAQRQQGYEDIAALMGLSVEEVRAKAMEAVAQMEAEGLPPPALPPEPAAPESFTPEPAPKAQPDPAPDPAAEGDSASPKAAPLKLSLPSDPGPRAAIAAGVIVIVLIVVLLIVSNGGDGDSATTASNPPAAETSTEASTTPAANSKEVTKAVLNPVGGGNATGVAIFGRVKNALALQVEVAGLTPTAQGQSYAIWLAQSPQRMLPLASTLVNKSGKIAAQFEVPVEVLAYLANETFDQLAITLTSNTALRASLAQATKEEKSPAYTGTEVLRGTITGPIVGAQLRKEAEGG